MTRIGPGRAGEPSQRTVVVLTTGGTIASRADSGGALAATTPGADLIRDLTDRAPTPLAPPAAGAVIETEEVMLLPSPEIGLAEMQLLAQRVEHHAARPDVCGIVITHGTDTMEETAFYLDLVGVRDVAVVITGAQHTAEDACFDGPANLASALYLAQALPRRRATLLLMGESVVAARGARKAHTVALEPYAGTWSAARDDLASIAEFPCTRPWSSAAAPLRDTDVPLATLHAGITGRHLASLAGEADGLLVAGFGMAAANAETAATLLTLADRGVLVCATTRCDDGPVRATYGQGGARDLLDGGVTLLAGLRPVAARLALQLALAAAGGDHALARTHLSSVCDVQHRTP